MANEPVPNMDDVTVISVASTPAPALSAISRAQYDADGQVRLWMADLTETVIVDNSTTPYGVELQNWKASNTIETYNPVR